MGQAGQELAVHAEVDALADQQTLDAVHVTRALAFQGQQLAVEMTLIFGGQAGDLDDAPHPRLTGVVAQEHGHQFLDVEAIGLGVLAAAADLDAGRVHHQVGDVLALEKAVQPKAVTTGFVAAHDRRISRQTETLLGQRNLLLERRRVAGGDLLLPRRLAEADGEAQLPVLVAQLEGQVEGRLWVTRCGVDGRFHGTLLSARQLTRFAPPVQAPGIVSDACGGAIRGHVRFARRSRR